MTSTEFSRKNELQYKLLPVLCKKQKKNMEKTLINRFCALQLPFSTKQDHYVSVSNDTNYVFVAFKSATENG